MRTALVIGTGLIGTSAALALSARGVRVHLADRDHEQVRTAASLGAGTEGEPAEPVDLAIVAVPPAHVAAAVCDVQRRGLARGSSTWAASRADRAVRWPSAAGT